MTIIEIDGIKYDVIDSQLTRNFQILDDGNSGRVQSGSMTRSIIGTYYNYTWKLVPKDLEDYDELYEVLSNPVKSHKVTIPYGQSEMTYEVYVTSGQDNLDKIEHGKKYWSGMTINFVAIDPTKRPA